MSTDSAVRPRRRTDGPARHSEKAPPEIPVLLRLPDLYPSRAVDAAVARLSTPLQASPNPGAVSESSSPSPDAPWQRVDAGPPSKPATSPVASSFPDWSSRIIVSGIIVTALVCAVLIQTRSTPDADGSSAGRNAASFHATAGTPVDASPPRDMESAGTMRVAAREPANPNDDVNESNPGERHGSKELESVEPPTTPARDAAYPAMPVQFNEPIRNTTNSPEPRNITTVHHNEWDGPDMPRTVRARQME